MIDFPASPTNGQVITLGDNKYIWNSTTSQWKNYNVLDSFPSAVTFNGTITGINDSTVSFTTSSCAASSYNYVLSAGNDTGLKLVCFVNGSTRSADGGVSAVTFRNDGGALNLGHGGYATNLVGNGISAAGTLFPSVTNTYDLGTSTLRWRNIYTQDLHLSNGIGDYTMIEGEEDLFLVNNKTGKHFKFALIEVDPSVVPPKAKTGVE